MITTSPLRRILTLSTLAIVALGAMALTGFWHPNAPAEAMRVYLPRITFPTVVVAAAVDCACFRSTLGLGGDCVVAVDAGGASDSFNPAESSLLSRLVFAQRAARSVGYVTAGSARRCGDNWQYSMVAVRLFSLEQESSSGG